MVKNYHTMVRSPNLCSLFSDFDKAFLSFPKVTNTDKNCFDVDAFEDSEGFLNIHFFVPGFKKEEITIDIKNNKDNNKSSNGIYVKCKKVNKKDHVKYIYRSNFYQEEFNNYISLPYEIDENNISAKLEDGVLMVKLVKNKEKERNSIKIKID